MLEIKKAQRKPLSVDYVEVTDENMVEVAAWCGGHILELENKKYIKIQTYRPKSPRQTMAFADSIVLESPEGYKIYNHDAFAKAFDLVHKTDDLDLMTDCSA